MTDLKQEFITGTLWYPYLWDKNKTFVPEGKWEAKLGNLNESTVAWCKEKNIPVFSKLGDKHMDAAGDFINISQISDKVGLVVIDAGKIIISKQMYIGNGTLAKVRGIVMLPKGQPHHHFYMNMVQILELVEGSGFSQTTEGFDTVEGGYEAEQDVPEAGGDNLEGFE